MASAIAECHSVQSSHRYYENLAQLISTAVLGRRRSMNCDSSAKTPKEGLC